MKLTHPLVDVHANSSTPVFFPLTPPLASVDLRWAQAPLWIEGADDDIKARLAVRYSDNGLTWDADAAVNAGYLTGSSTPGWQFPTGMELKDLESLATPRLFAQLGAQVATTGTTTMRTARIGLSLLRSDMGGNVLTFGPIRVYTARASAAWRFFPVTGWLPPAGVGGIRFVMETFAMGSNITVAMGFQQANKPLVVADRTTPDDFTAPSRTSNGTTWPTTFDTTTMVLDKERFRIGVMAKQTSATGEPNLAMVQGRIEWRR